MTSMLPVVHTALDLFVICKFMAPDQLDVTLNGKLKVMNYSPSKLCLNYELWTCQV